ncbi:TDP-N-acetylfucosamine:lipid II N-acetylfucosaminyltransferase [Alkalihalobacillus deserti]|uniref:TDP-N-acetylfucosamine:lipid II N-acetylfucosaminyltransferase n=1 Tax=Alkalihalobacillus deserti TaxID=2879466 RepID=UPI001D152342|nr:TDP-N-acetylfucosamine:lipid II N-acetylfucosaminyltransferase [Alkalihalobacillus deserti]
MKVLHVFNNEKFVNQYIEFMDLNFDYSDHFFLIIGDNKGFEIKSGQNVLQLTKDIKSVRTLISKMNRCDKLIIHGLSNPNLVKVLFMLPWVLRKSHWVIWGSDLYYYNFKDKTFKNWAFEIVRKTVIKNISGFITHIEGDYDLAKKWYGTKGDYHYCFMYPSNLYKDYKLTNELKNTKRIIQIGNSADPSNNHIEIFEKLALLPDKNFEIICPLSYGDPNYARFVIDKGKEMFGDKFQPLTEFIPFKQYLETLARIDIAIFNHKRQQAVGNITTLLSLGKKVYIRNDITTWRFCEEHGLKVFSTNELQSLFKPLPQEIKDNNQKKMMEQFSKKKLVNDWKNIFEGIE